MKLGTRGRYAVTALTDLALRKGDGPVSLAAIAERQGLSQSYLEQLFASLKRNDLIKSNRGPGGGYQLARPASQIYISEIVLAVDEPMHATMCKPGGKPCGKQDVKCLTHDLWDELGNQIMYFLSAVTLEDLITNRVSGLAQMIERRKEKVPLSLAAE